MKIAMVTNNFYPCIGGVEKVVQDMGEKLSKRGHEISVLCLNKCANSGEKLPEKGRRGSINIERMPYLDLKYYKIALSVLNKVKEADVIHVHGVGFFSDFLIATKLLHKKPVVVSTHGGIFHTKKIALLKKIYFHTVQRILLNFCVTVAVSKNDFKLFSGIASPVLIQNGVSAEKFKHGKKEKNTFLFLGRFSKNKRVENLLDAFSKIEGNYKLLIAGTDWENLLSGYKKKCMELGIENKIKFILNPKDNETKELYAKSEYFVSASQYEGFGIALVEAMASGCIPIVQKNEGFSNIITENKNGYFADFDSSESHKKIESVMKKDNMEIIEGALKRSKDFSVETGVNKLEKIYMEICK